MKIIINERQYNIIKEQVLGGLLDMPDTGQDVVGLHRSTNAKEYSDAEKVKNLFILAKKWSSTTQDWKSIEPIVKKMHNELSGIGSGSFLTELAKIKTTNQLAALVKNWNYDKQNLYAWLSSEYGISWSQVLGVLRKNFNKHIVNNYIPTQSVSS